MTEKETELCSCQKLNTPAVAYKDRVIYIATINAKTSYTLFCYEDALRTSFLSRAVS